MLHRFMKKILRHRLCLILWVIGAGAAIAAEPSPGPLEEVVKIGTLHGKMRYDVEHFSVSPGSKVSLLFNNTDEMLHNLVICSPGAIVATEVAMKAWTLGADAMAKQFIPDDPRVLFFTKVIEPGKGEKLIFEAPKKPGDYPYVCTLPGHAQTMRGIMRVGSASTGVSGLKYDFYEGKWDKLPNFTPLTPVASGELPENLIDLAVAKRDNHFGLVFTGALKVPTEGEYTFYLNSDDGSRLLIDGTSVVAYDGIHPAEAERNGTIRLGKGAHQFRVEFFDFEDGRKLDLAWEGPGVARASLSAGNSAAAEPKASPNHLVVGDRPLVIRSFLKDGPPRAISVGLPGGVSYCFDAEKASVAFGWIGGFLNVGPDRGTEGGERGGGWSMVMGERFSVGDLGFPLRFGDPEKKPDVSFEGYRRSNVPEFLMIADGVEVRQTIRAAESGNGLVYEFSLGKVPADVFFKIAPEGLELSSSAGTWKGGLLRVPSAEAADFTITLIPRR